MAAMARRREFGCAMGVILLAVACSDSDDGPVVYPKPEGDPIGTWETLPALAGTRYVSARVMAGSEYISWGSDASSAGDILNVETGEWRKMSLAGAPAARDESIALWTGNEMLIWGGCPEALPTAYADGGLYDPATDTWRAVSTVGAPSARRFEMTAWTGEEMLVWGGADYRCAGGGPANAVLTDGAAYNPSTDTWRPMATEGAPSARVLASHVWTGKELVVWGGTTATDLDTVEEIEGARHLGDGAAYSPKTDTWRLVSSEHAPVANWGVSSEWTGTEMLFWGDWSDDGGRATMAAYNPTTDFWREMNPAGPHLHYGSCTAWTGKYFVMCGDETDPEGGAAYDPVEDIWHPIPAVPNPYASGLGGFAYQGDVLAFGGWDHYSFYSDTIGYRLRMPD
jgi:N-acetylneuraminic acid mutarotase